MWYLDTSALVKLVVHEAETEPLQRWLATEDRNPIACDLVRTELQRAVKRVAPDRMVAARAVLDSLTLIQVTTAIFESAARVETALVRSLDAIHLAAAIELGDELAGIVTYDDRMAEAAAGHGITVMAPR